MDDIDILRQMYAVLCGAVDDALTLLENANVWEAQRRLQAALSRAEELYIAGTAAEDEISPRRP